MLLSTNIINNIRGHIYAYIQRKNLLIIINNIVFILCFALFECCYCSVSMNFLPLCQKQ